MYRSTYKDDINKSATEKLVKEVKGNNKSFLEHDIQGKDEFNNCQLLVIFIIYSCCSYLLQKPVTGGSIKKKWKT